MRARAESAYAHTIHDVTKISASVPGSRDGGASMKREKIRLRSSRRQGLWDEERLSWLGSYVERPVLACLRVSRKEVTVKVLNHIPRDSKRKLLIAGPDKLG